MREKTLEFIWYIYLFIGWPSVFLVNFYNLTSYYLYAVVIIGFIIYIKYLKYVKKVELFELNYKTLLFDMILYIYFVIIGISIWYIFYKLGMYFYPAQFIKVFPEIKMFYIMARRMILIGSFLGIMIIINSGVNHAYDSLYFTNKVAVLDVLFILIGLLWVMFDINYATLFVSLVSIHTLPSSARRGLAGIFKYVFGKELNLEPQKIENNISIQAPPLDLKDNILNITALITLPILNSFFIQVPMGVALLSICFFEVLVFR